MSRSKTSIALIVVLVGIKLGYTAYRNHSATTTIATTSSLPALTTTTDVVTTTQPSISTTSTPMSRAMATPETLTPTGAGALTGRIIAIDPGHNGNNWSVPSVISQLVPDGRGEKACDTTGTSTNDGYPEASFSYAVAMRLSTLLRAAGATVVLTRSNNASVGPCVNRRAEIGNEAHADVALSIHGDGAPASGRGFTVLVPVRSSVNGAIVTPSSVLARDVVTAFQSAMPISNYLGSNGVDPRSDLAGLNLTTVPKVLIECGNMRNSTDAALMKSATWQDRAAQALANALTTYLGGNS